MATLIACIVVSISATQVAMTNLQSFGLEVSLSQRLQAIGNDLVGFGPMLFLICALAYLVGFLVAYGLSKIILNRLFWGIIAGLTAVPTAYWLINETFGMSLLQTTNYTTGWLGIIIGSLAGSLFYHTTINNKIED